MSRIGNYPPLDNPFFRHMTLLHTKQDVQDLSSHYTIEDIPLLKSHFGFAYAIHQQHSYSQHFDHSNQGTVQWLCRYHEVSDSFQWLCKFISNRLQ